MDYLLVGIIAAVASGLTLFSGFGLGTILMPVMAIFFPVEIAIGMTAIVHLLNNLFKAVLLGRYASRTAVLRFGLPAIVTAFIGARLLLFLADLPALASYEIFGRQLTILPVKSAVAALMVVFGLFEFLPVLKDISFDKKFLPLGGALSGFFGGVSGHQGALRSAFLIKIGLSKEAFIGTGVIIACLVDISRLLIYTSSFSQAISGDNLYILLTAIMAAFLGAFIGNRLIEKITLKTVSNLVAVMLILIAVGLGLGLI